MQPDFGYTPPWARGEGRGLAVEIVQEMWAFLKVRKKFWLAPIIIALLLLAGLFVLAGQAGVISPFIYAL